MTAEAPIAYANPSRVLDAFDLDDVWIDGTAMQVKGDPNCPIDSVTVVHGNGRVTQHKLPVPVVVNTPAGPIRFTAEPMLEPGEFRVGPSYQQSVQGWTRRAPNPTPIPGIEQRCARCGVLFQFLATDTNVDAVLAAHQERCFVVGEHIRWYPDGSDEVDLIDPDRFVDGIVVDKGRTCLKATAVSGCLAGLMRYSIGAVIDWSISPGTIRRIPRPGQEVAWRQVYQKPWGLQQAEQPAWHCASCGIGVTKNQPIGDQIGRCQVCSGSNAPTKQGVIMGRTGLPIGWVERPNLSKTAICAGTWTHGAELLHHCSQPADHEGNCYDGPPLRSEPLYVEPPAPTLYDGLTSTACLSRWRENRECAEYSIPLIHEMTPDQIAEAKRVYAVVAAGTWSEHLRRKVAASRSAERCQVVLDDDEALLAGCRSVE